MKLGKSQFSHYNQILTPPNTLQLQGLRIGVTIGALPYQGGALPTELRKHALGLKVPKMYLKDIGDPERTRTVGLQRDRLAF